MAPRTSTASRPTRTRTRWCTRRPVRESKFKMTYSRWTKALVSLSPATTRLLKTPCSSSLVRRVTAQARAARTVLFMRRNLSLRIAALKKPPGVGVRISHPRGQRSTTRMPRGGSRNGSRVALRSTRDITRARRMPSSTASWERRWGCRLDMGGEEKTKSFSGGMSLFFHKIL